MPGPSFCTRASQGLQSDQPQSDQLLIDTPRWRRYPCKWRPKKLFRALGHPTNMRFLSIWWRFFTALQLLPVIENGEETTLVGGQAVLEGVMMRSPHAWGIACRKASGEVITHSQPLERMSEKHKWMGWPGVRGFMTLGNAMGLGYRATKLSANAALEE